MVMVSSTMMALGTAAPAFQLPDVVSGDTISLDTFAGKSALLVMFICEHCPFVKHVETELARLGQDYGPKNVGIVAISANSVQTHPQDAPEHLKAMAIASGSIFPFAMTNLRPRLRPTPQPAPRISFSLMATLSWSIGGN
jgi:thiol-disulfide isomerase/thioredoxin